LQPLVSVVIPYSNKRHIVKTVKSVLLQSYSRVEIIMPVSASDRHSELLQPYSDRIRFIVTANKRTAGAMNEAFRQASGGYIACLYPDNRFHWAKLEKQLDAMVKKGAWISHTAYDLMDKDGDDAAPLFEPSVAAAPSGHDLQTFYSAFETGNPVNGSTFMMRKELFERMGGFNETLHFTYELDLWLRVMMHGYPFHYVSEPLTSCRQDEEAMGEPEQNREDAALETERTRALHSEKWKQFLKQIGMQSD
jgi:teichuronic acid biosynthesis glycosyltransferase TuaG